MKRTNLLAIQTLAFVLFLLLFSSCAEEPFDGGNKPAKGHTVTLRLSATVSPIPETKASAQPAGGNAATSGFYCEMISSDAETDAEAEVEQQPGFDVDMEDSPAGGISLPLATKAPSTLKNMYALLFKSDGAFNGRTAIGDYTVGTATDITFIDVKDATAANGHLVIVANDIAAVTPYESSTPFADFTGSYADFQALTISNTITIDQDVPYAGSATLSLTNGEIAATVAVSIYRTLAKITLNNTFNISDGPTRSSITLHNAGLRRFAPLGENAYDGTGTTNTIAYEATTTGNNANSVTWYVGENIQSNVASIKSGADRNTDKAPAGACYVRIESGAKPLAGNTNTSPAIGEEYIVSGSKSFTYDLYLGKSSDVTDFSLRRNTNYTLNISVTGTLSSQEQLAAIDGRVRLTNTTAAGLVLGCFGGSTGYTTGAGAAPTISGSYNKLLLLQPNTSGSTAMDNVTRVWSDNTTTVQLQSDTRKYWDPTYTLAHIDETDGFAYDYCKKLTLGGVPEGTWYLPTEAQLQMIYSLYGGMKTGGFEGYTGFTSNQYWSSTENDAANAWFTRFSDGYTANMAKNTTTKIRCVRDLTAASSQYVITNHPSAPGYPVIDLSELAPLNAVLSQTEAADRRDTINAQTSNDKVLVHADAGLNGAWNRKMSPKFQVMRANLASSDRWAAGYEGCKGYDGSSDGAAGTTGEWRLPTQRELLMIWVLHPQLRGKEGFTAFGTFAYWSCTENNSGNAWCVYFNIGATHSGSKTDNYRVRCVRDLE